MIVQSTAEFVPPESFYGPTSAGGDSKTLILDFETSSGSQKIDSLNTWSGNCRIAGTGVASAAMAENGLGLYLPTGHTTGDSSDGLKNRAADQLDPHFVKRYLWDLLQGCDTILGHHIKYDLHVLANNWDSEQFPFSKEILKKKVVDTVVRAKLTDSDRYGYSMKALEKDWLDIEEHKDVLKPYTHTSAGNWFNKDYGQIPVDVCGPYCVEDLLTTWKLENYCRENMHESSAGIAEIEIALTKILFVIERTGMRVDLQRLHYLSMGTEQKLLRLQEDIHKVLLEVKCRKQYIRPAENPDCFDVFCSHYGLPVLEWTAGGKGGKNKKPSFNKVALKAYLCHPKVLADEKLKSIVSMVMEFRKWNTINNMFLTPYKELHVDGLLHGSFNQIIRTGRMAMSTPNMQQCPTEVRYLISPWDQSEDFRLQYEHSFVKDGVEKTAKGLTLFGVDSDEVITARDASQIEFRLIVNYCRNARALKAYQNDPTTDYHQYMADLCGIERSPAKNINFALSYGGGKYRCLNMLKDALDLLGVYGENEKIRFEGQVLHVPEVTFTTETGEKKVIQKEMNLEGYDAFCWVKATKVFNTYHSRLPELRKISWKAQDLAKKRGYLLNLYGRCRKLPEWQSNKAFNSIIQSSAADILKERTVAFYNYLESEGVLFTAACGESPAGKIKLTNSVHDELVTSEPRELAADERLQTEIMNLLCHPEGMVAKMDVPMLWDKGIGEQSWGQAK